MSKPDYDTSLARMAGNIAAGLVADPQVFRPTTLEGQGLIALVSVQIARAIIAEIKRSASPEPQP